MKFSVLMSVYIKEEPIYLDEALKSIVSQTLPADEIIIVEDGPLSPDLYAVLDRYSHNEGYKIKRYPLESNQGLGNALNVGIKETKNELIARMDSDDISVPNRFELQIAEFSKDPELDILGGQIAEFVNSPDEIVAYRRVPLTYEEIKQFARRRNPFNHPTVMYKKSAIESLGCYDSSAIRVEDYDLWLRALSNGVVCTNIDDTLLHYRSTDETMKRRKTFTSLRNHIKARVRFYKKRYISFSDFLYGVITQTVLFILPMGLADAVFKRVTRKDA